MDGRKWKGASWGIKSNRWCHPKPAKIPTEQSGKVAGFQALVADVLAVFRWRKRQGYDGWSSSFRLVPSLTGGVARIRRYGRVDFGSNESGFGSVVGSSLTASLSLSHTCICFPSFPTSYFAFINFLTVSFLFIYFSHMLHWEVSKLEFDQFLHYHKSKFSASRGRSEQFLSSFYLSR